MSMSDDPLAEAKAAVQAAIDASTEETERLLAAKKLLRGPEPNPGRAAPKPKRRQSKPKGKQAKKGQRRGEVLALVAKQPGISGAGIANALDVNASQVYGILRALVKEKAVNKKGQLYHPKPQTNAAKAEADAKAGDGAKAAA